MNQPIDDNTSPEEIRKRVLNATARLTLPEKIDLAARFFEFKSAFEKATPDEKREMIRTGELPKKKTVLSRIVNKINKFTGRK